MSNTCEFRVEGCLGREDVLIRSNC